MFLSLHRNRDPFYQIDPFNQYHRLRREMDDLLAPTLYLLQNMTPRSAAHPHNHAPNEADRSKNFEVKLNVEDFSPEELSIKLVDDCVVVEGKHEERRDDQGYISRHFVRRYTLPQDVKPEAITCDLSSDGVLKLSAPRAIEEPKVNERNLPINFTGQPAVAGVNANPGEGDGTGKKTDGVTVNGDNQAA